MDKADSSPILTPELYERYKKYKRATQIVTSWISVNSQKAGFVGFDPSTCDIDLLVRAASTTLRAGFNVPSEIYWSLKDAIRDRLYIMKHYNDNDPAHTKFINGPVEHPRIIEAEDGNDEPEAELELEPCIETTKRETKIHKAKRRFGDRPTEDQYVKLRRRLGISGDTSANLSIKDDPIYNSWNVKLGVINTILTADSLCETLKEYWSSCRERKLSPLVAVMLTNTAMKLFSLVDNTNRVSLGISNHATFLDKMKNMGEVESDSIRQWRFSESLGVFASGKGFVNVYDQIVQSKHPEGLIPKPRTEKPAVFIPRISEHEESTTYLEAQAPATKSFLLKIRALQKSCSCLEKCKKLGILDKIHVDFRSPLEHNVGMYWKDYTDLDTTTVFCMQAMLETFESYLWHESADLNSSNCHSRRLEFFKEAQQQLNSLDHLLSVRKINNSHNVTQRLPYLIAEVDAELAPTAFDLYTQSPWAAWSSIMYLWYDIQDTSAQLCTVMGIVPAVMHLHNCLVQTGWIKKGEIPVLDRLADVLEPSVFLGSRPKRNFLSHHETAIGGQLVHDYTHKGHHHSGKSGHSAGTCGKTLTVRASSTVCPCNPKANRVRAEDSLAHTLISKEFHPDAQFFCKVNKLRETPTNIDKMHKLVDDLAKPGNAPLGINRAILDKVKEILEDDLYGSDMPFARIDWILMFLRCCDTVLSITQRLIAKGVPIRQCCFGCSNEPSGLEFVRWFLMATDGIDQEKGDGMESVWISGSNVIKEALVANFESLNIADFLWDP